MPSPFPGMDPYLVDPARFPGLHQFLITGLATTLNGLLPRSYVASVQERLYVEQSGRSIYPDTSVIKRSPSTRTGRKPKEKGGVALAWDPAWEIAIGPEEFRESYIDIVATADQGRVITTIEILSPANKTPGTEGHEQYEKKQREVLSSRASFLEIDLLRSGSHTVSAPQGGLSHRGHYDYLVCLSRGKVRHRFEVWARTLREKLPRVPVPLASDDADIVVDLQSVFDRAYEDGAFERQVDYVLEPRVALSPADLAWAKTLVRKHALRR